jgi:hypothetical protein
MTAPIDVLAQLRLPDARLWVDAAEDWQVDDMRQVFAEDGPLYGFITRSRGSSKTGDLAAAALSLLLSVDEPALLVWAAADADQGRLAIEAIEGYAERSPTIAAQVEVQARKVVAKATGARLVVMPADAASSWGITPYAVFIDEAANWPEGTNPERFFDSLASAVAKREDARLVVLTTPSTPDHWSYKVLEHARSSAAWWTSERHGPAPWMSEERVAEQRDRLPRAIFEQLFEGIWTSAADAFLDADLLDACFTLPGPSPERRRDASHFAGLDLGLTGDRTVFAVAHRRGRRTYLDHMQVWEGTKARPVDLGAVEAHLIAQHQLYGYRLVFDPWQAAALGQRLKAAGVPAEPFTFTAKSKQRLAAALLEGVNTATLALFGEDLRDELRALRLRQSASGWSFDHVAGRHDDRAVALSLALLGTIEGGALQSPVFFDTPDGYEFTRHLTGIGTGHYEPPWTERRW